MTEDCQGKHELNDISTDKSLEKLYQSIDNHIFKARANILKSVNHEQVIAYWHIGKNIVEQ